MEDVLYRTYRNIRRQVDHLTHELQELYGALPEWSMDPEEDVLLLDIRDMLDLLLFFLEGLYETLDRYRFLNRLKG